MSRWILLVILLITPVLQAGEIRVTLNGEALVAAPLYAELVLANQVEWSPAIQQLRVDVSEQNPVFSFVRIPEGLYAVRVFLDLDEDGKLNRSRRGLPLEPVGFSLCALQERSEPSPMDCGFVHDQAQTAIQLDLIHLKR